jgi:D-alanine-D-alanine ligase
MGDRALGALEIRPAKGFYDYDAKYAPGGSDHLVPAPIHAKAYAQALDVALAAHKALGCRGVSRADLRYDDTKGEPGRIVLLEVNTQPGMTPTSLVPDIARHAGISFAELVQWMVENAACDF